MAIRLVCRWREGWRREVLALEVHTPSGIIAEFSHDYLVQILSHYLRGAELMARVPTATAPLPDPPLKPLAPMRPLRGAAGRRLRGRAS